MTKKELFEALAEACVAMADALRAEAVKRDAQGHLDEAKLMRSQALLDRVAADGLADLAAKS